MKRCALLCVGILLLVACGDDDGPLTDAGAPPGDSSVSECSDGLLECGGTCVDTGSDRGHCGACDNVCAVGEACVGGACEISCPAGQIVCDGRCVDTSSDRLSCGACGTPCGAGEVCADGTCIVSCPAGQSACGGACTDTESSPRHCGGCDVACGAGEVCSEGACASSCGAGLMDCSGACVDTANDPAHCGACDNACSGDTGATGLCVASSCRAVCDPLLGDCNGDLGMTGGDGCELSLATDPANCGVCGFVCTLPNAVSGCAAGDCAVASCDAGSGDCDGVASNGCEVDLASADANCGACGTVCGVGERCVDSSCVAAPGDQCSGAIALTAGANTVSWTAYSRDYLVNPSCTTYDPEGPDIVLSYTATTDERVALSFAKPTSTRWAASVSTAACGTLTPELACISEFSGTAMTGLFALGAGETATVYVVDTDSGDSPLDSPLTVNLTAEACTSPPTVSVDPPSGSSATTFRPSFTATFSTPVNPSMGVVTITGDMGTSLSYDLSTSPAQVDFSSDDTVMTIDPAVSFAEGELLTLSWSGLQAALCATPAAVPPPTWTLLIPDPPCTPGAGGLVGATTSRLSTGGLLSLTEYYVAADESPTGYVYVGGSSELYRIAKTGGAVEDVTAAAGIDFDQLGYAMLIDGTDIYTLEADASTTSERLWRISTDGGATWSVEDYASFATTPGDDFRGMTAYGGRIYLVTDESSTDPTEIWSVDAAATTLPAVATMEVSVPGEEDCSGIVRDTTYYYLTCGTGDRLVRVPVAGGPADLVTDSFDFNITVNALHGDDTDGDGLIDVLYVHGYYEEIYYVCNPGTTPFAARLVNTGTDTTNYGLGFDRAANVLWTFDDDNSQFVSAQ